MTAQCGEEAHHEARQAKPGDDAGEWLFEN